MWFDTVCVRFDKAGFEVCSHGSVRILNEGSIGGFLLIRASQFLRG